MLDQRFQEVQEKINLLKSRISTFQNTDGGFKGFAVMDDHSGVWTTASIVHICATTWPRLSWLEDAYKYIRRAQNADGGFPFRIGGKSVTDVTSWSCLALSHTDASEQIEHGMEFMLEARNNLDSPHEDAWGLTQYEPDRVYSTWIAAHSLMHLRKNGYLSTKKLEIERAVTDAALWILNSRQTDGGWRTEHDQSISYTATSMAILTLLHTPNNLNASSLYELFEVLMQGRQLDGLWDAENELVVVREGYELNQVWFTSVFVFEALLELLQREVLLNTRGDTLGVDDLATVEDVYQRLSQLILADGTVHLTQTTSADLVWPVPQMLSALVRYRSFLSSNKQEYSKFLEHEAERARAKKLQDIQRRIRTAFPFPVSSAFSMFQAELDHHRRFEIMLQTAEVLVKYATIVCIAGYLSNREGDERINGLLSSRFMLPTLGDWGQLLLALLRNPEGLRNLLVPDDPESVLESPGADWDNTVVGTNLAELLDDFRSLRNKTVGHGALRSMYDDKILVDHYESKLYAFFDRLDFLAQGNSFLILSSEYDEFGESDLYRIRIFKGTNVDDSKLETDRRLAEGQRDTMIRYLYYQNTTTNRIVNLYPFLSYGFCQECKREQFFVYNGTSKSVTQYMSYGCGHSIQQQNNHHFQKRMEACGGTWLNRTI